MIFFKKNCLHFASLLPVWKRVGFYYFFWNGLYVKELNIFWSKLRRTSHPAFAFHFCILMQICCFTVHVDLIRCWEYLISHKWPCRKNIPYLPVWVFVSLFSRLCKLRNEARQCIRKIVFAFWCAGETPSVVMTRGLTVLVTDRMQEFWISNERGLTPVGRFAGVGQHFYGRFRTTRLPLMNDIWYLPRQAADLPFITPEKNPTITHICNLWNVMYLELFRRPARSIAKWKTQMPSLPSRTAVQQLLTLI